MAADAHGAAAEVAAAAADHGVAVGAVVGHRLAVATAVHPGRSAVVTADRRDRLAAADRPRGPSVVGPHRGRSAVAIAGDRPARSIATLRDPSAAEMLDHRVRSASRRVRSAIVRRVVLLSVVHSKAELFLIPAARRMAGRRCGDRLAANLPADRSSGCRRIAARETATRRLANRYVAADRIRGRVIAALGEVSGEARASRRNLAARLETGAAARRLAIRRASRGVLATESRTAETASSIDRAGRPASRKRRRTMALAKRMLRRMRGRVGAGRTANSQTAARRTTRCATFCRCAATAARDRIKPTILETEALPAGSAAATTLTIRSTTQRATFARKTCALDLASRKTKATGPGPSGLAMARAMVAEIAVGNLHDAMVTTREAATARATAIALAAIATEKVRS
jgi:hypothetical protein